MSLTTNPARPQTPAGPVSTVTPPRPPRHFAACPVCHSRKLVRADGLISKHGVTYSTTGPRRCAGSDAVPIPVPVPDVDYSRRGRDAAKLLERWDFLSMPLNVLLLTTRASLLQVAPPYLEFAGSIQACNDGSFWAWLLRVPIGQDPLERDLMVRGLLAAAHGVSVTGWPIEMGLRSA